MLGSGTVSRWERLNYIKAQQTRVLVLTFTSHLCTTFPLLGKVKVWVQLKGPCLLLCRGFRDCLL
jgi:hypothetical protein